MFPVPFSKDFNVTRRIVWRTSVAALILASLTLTGCGRYALNNSSLDYQKAAVLPPLNLPVGQETRPIRPIYKVPDMPHIEGAAPMLTNARHNQFVMPAPLPLDTSQIVNQKTVDVGTPSLPVLVVDGNGYPLLTITGQSSRIWTMLQQALTSAGAHIIRQDAALERIDVQWNNKPYMLRTSHAGAQTTVSVQTSKDVLVETGQAQAILNQLVQHWPNE